MITSFFNENRSLGNYIQAIYKAIQLGQTHQRHAHAQKTPLLCNDLVIIHYD